MKGRPTQIVGLRGCGDGAKMEVPAVAGESPRERLRGRFEIRTRESSARKRRAKPHDATRWRTQFSGAVDADPRTVIHRSARIPRDGDAAGGAHGPVVQGVHGRDANSDEADFSDGKPDYHAALGVGLGRDRSVGTEYAGRRR